MNKSFQEVLAELQRAEAKFQPFNSSHEGYAVILEELDELWDEIKNNKRPDTLSRQRAEAVQVAAMGLRFISMIDSKISPVSTPAPPVEPRVLERIDQCLSAGEVKAAYNAGMPAAPRVLTPAKLYAGGDGAEGRWFIETGEHRLAHSNEPCRGDLADGGLVTIFPHEFKHDMYNICVEVQRTYSHAGKTFVPAGYGAPEVGERFVDGIDGTFVLVCGEDVIKKPLSTIDGGKRVLLCEKPAEDAAPEGCAIHPGKVSCISRAMFDDTVQDKDNTIAGLRFMRIF